MYRNYLRSKQNCGSIESTKGKMSSQPLLKAIGAMKMRDCIRDAQQTPHHHHSNLIFHSVQPSWSYWGLRSSQHLPTKEAIETVELADYRSYRANKTSSSLFIFIAVSQAEIAITSSLNPLFWIL